eukprot:TRINITY_DN41331_c0_g1_i1.p3 TRINITY_DN41331_c0_g1~~TRINITY_DN41331_c0_g1_i1.p3  ORF type:complete len:111 (-),score=7.29 TRINITY_DN41331_c0_g1_i1:69-401(-)
MVFREWHTCGGAGGNRTRVRRRFREGHYVRSLGIESRETRSTDRPRLRQPRQVSHPGAEAPAGMLAHFIRAHPGAMGGATRVNGQAESIESDQAAIATALSLAIEVSVPF